jgi:hypothetical protein
MEVTTPTVEPKDLPEDISMAKPDRAYATKPSSPAKSVDTGAFGDDDVPSVTAHGTAGNVPGTGAAVGGAAPPKGRASGDSEEQLEKSVAKDAKVVKAPTVDAPKDKVAAPVATAPAKPSPSAPATTATTTAKKESTPSANDRDLQSAVTAAQQNKCDLADHYATSIANRDLDYYASQVEDNRELKHCKAVMKNAPNAAEKQRAKRAQVRTTTEPTK